MMHDPRHNFYPYQGTYLPVSIGAVLALFHHYLAVYPINSPAPIQWPKNI
jgi:hypothetical protein